ncbi:unnamed protein product [Peniophora sp. CBMAI 1063]|nr:unnamed protein product [Peniophora sp. CBMAI 1063]
MPTHMIDRVLFTTYLASYTVHELEGATDLNVPPTVEALEFSALAVHRGKHYLVVYGDQVGITEDRELASNAANVPFGLMFVAPNYHTAYTWYRYWMSDMMFVLSNQLDIQWGVRDFLLVAARGLTRAVLRVVPVLRPRDLPAPMIPDMPEKFVIEVDDEEENESHDMVGSQREGCDEEEDVEVELEVVLEVGSEHVGGGGGGDFAATYHEE